MRFFSAAVALFASLALAQQNAINIPSGQSTLDITAGEPQTITWTNPSDGTVTIKLQQSGSGITPDSGIVLASSIPASSETATFTIDPTQVNSFQYTIEIIDDSNPSSINFSPNFGVKGAESTSTGTVSSAASTGSSSASASASASMSSGSSMSTMTSDSSSSAAASSSSAAASSSTAASTSESAASTSSAASASQTTSAPDSTGNGAGMLKVQGGLVAAVAVAVAVL